jgi:hypothetical protein
LVQGEYVEFSLSNTTTTDHEFQAGEVCGIKGGKLMCETRRDLRVARSQYKTKDDIEPASSPRVAMESERIPRAARVPESDRSPRARGSGPREEGQWTHVSKSNNKKVSDAEAQNVAPRKTDGVSGRGRGRPPRGGRGGGKQ